ncbi:amidohydrolase family protein [Haliea sp. E1-2-M8]|uniref:amidohydrolase family protein n=1 Tax=Haliea sp. E1-2-M8 TaxID=3064706 RepID=UPI0027283099|nr:amidohydrolase family protein [Haliea sp. E1-2-M8]MDO8861994.1 amidohydrolase family protein [Haliea sp. E1-2-M8]
MSVDISPDGRSLVFDLLGDLYLLPVGGGAAMPLTSGMAIDQHPRFSPDGGQVAFISDRSGTSDLWLIDIDSGRTSRPAAQQPSERPTREVINPAWHPDGSSVISTRMQIFRPQAAPALVSQSVVDDTGRTISVQGPPGSGALSPAYSPDGRSVYFELSRNCAAKVAYAFVPPCSQVQVLDLVSGQQSVVSDREGGGMRPQVSPDGRWLVYASRRVADTGLRIRDLQSGEERWLIVPIERDIQDGNSFNGTLPAYAFTPDASALVIAFAGKIWRVDVPSGEREEIPFQVDVQRELGPLQRYPNKLPDGPVQIRHIRYPRVSPDGMTVVFTALSKVWIMDLAGGNPRRLTNTGRDVIERYATWSPDGANIVFSSWSPESGGRLVRTLPGSGTVTGLAQHSGEYVFPVYTTDGRHLIVSKVGVLSDTDRIRRYDIVALPAEGGAERHLTSVARPHDRPMFGETTVLHVSGNPERVWFTDPSQGVASINIETGERCNHFALDPVIEGHDYAPDTGVGYEFVPDASLSQALMRIARQIYRIDLTDIDLTKCTGQPLTLGYSGSGPAMERLSRYGGLYPSWSPHDGAAVFSTGTTIFRYAAVAPDSIGNESSVLDLTRQPAMSPLTVKLTLPRPRSDNVAALRGARILTMAGGDVIENGDLLIRGRRIVAVGKRGEVAIPDNATIFDLGGKFILPGFINTHCHETVSRTTGPAASAADSWQLRNYLAYGVTTCVDVYAHQQQLELADLIDAGQSTGARLLTTGRGLKWNEVVRSHSEAESAVWRDRRFWHTPLTKYYVAGNRLQQQWVVQAADTLSQSVVSEGLHFARDLSSITDGIGGLAHSVALPVFYDDMRQFIARAGTVLHMQPAYVGWNNAGAKPFSQYLATVDQQLLSDPKARRFWMRAALLRKLRTNLAVPQAEHTITRFARGMRQFVDAGGTVALGEHGEFLGTGYHWEIWAMATGLDADLALQAATRMGAEAIGYSDDLGTVEIGKVADLVVLEEDPMLDIFQTRSLSTVIKDGTIYDAETLDQIWPVSGSLPAPQK